MIRVRTLLHNYHKKTVKPLMVLRIKIELCCCPTACSKPRGRQERGSAATTVRERNGHPSTHGRGC